MEKIQALPPGIEVSPIIIWLPRRSLAKLMAIHIIPNAMPQNSAWRDTVKGFGSEVILLTMKARPMYVTYDEYDWVQQHWGDDLIKQTHSFLKSKWDEINDGKIVFVFESYPGGYALKERILYEDYIVQVKSKEESLPRSNAKGTPPY